MTIQPPIERHGARIHDLRLEAGSEAYLVEPMVGGRGASILTLHWFMPPITRCVLARPASTAGTF